MTTELSARAILFDMDGTLVDSTAIVEKTWGRFADQHQIPIGEILATSHGVKAIDSIKRYAPDIDADAAAADLAAFEITQTDGIVEIPGAAEFTRMLPPGAFALVTSAPRELAMMRLELCSIEVPRVVVAAEDVSSGKPHPEPYLSGAEQLGVSAADCIVFEDAPAGILAGLAAGMRVVVVGDSDDEAAKGLPRISDYSSLTVRDDGEFFTVVIGGQ